MAGAASCRPGGPTFGLDCVFVHPVKGRDGLGVHCKLPTAGYEYNATGCPCSFGTKHSCTGREANCKTLQVLDTWQRDNCNNARESDVYAPTAVTSAIATSCVHLGTRVNRPLVSTDCAGTRHALLRTWQRREERLQAGQRQVCTMQHLHDPFRVKNKWPLCKQAGKMLAASQWCVSNVVHA